MNTVKLEILEKDLSALQNDDMDPAVFAKLVNKIEQVCIDLYGPVGAKEYVKKVAKEGRVALIINQRIAVGVSKFLVENLNVQVKLARKTEDGLKEKYVITTPFNANKLKKELPYYTKATNKR